MPETAWIDLGPALVFGLVYVVLWLERRREQQQAEDYNDRWVKK